jgi:hypothetical protein
MREFASVTCPGCGAKVDVPLGVTMVICDGRQQVQG